MEGGGQKGNFGSGVKRKGKKEDLKLEEIFSEKVKRKTTKDVSILFLNDEEGAKQRMCQPDMPVILCVCVCVFLIYFKSLYKLLYIYIKYKFK